MSTNQDDRVQHIVRAWSGVADVREDDELVRLWESQRGAERIDEGLYTLLGMCTHEFDERAAPLRVENFRPGGIVATVGGLNSFLSQPSYGYTRGYYSAPVDDLTRLLRVLVSWAALKREIKKLSEELDDIWFEGQGRYAPYDPQAITLLIPRLVREFGDRKVDLGPNAFGRNGTIKTVLNLYDYIGKLPRR